MTREPRCQLQPSAALRLPADWLVQHGYRYHMHLQFLQFIHFSDIRRCNIRRCGERCRDQRICSFDAAVVKRVADETDDCGDRQRNDRQHLDVLQHSTSTSTRRFYQRLQHQTLAFRGRVTEDILPSSLQNVPHSAYL